MEGGRGSQRPGASNQGQQGLSRGEKRELQIRKIREQAEAQHKLSATQQGEISSSGLLQGTGLDAEEGARGVRVESNHYSLTVDERPLFFYEVSVHPPGNTNLHREAYYYWAEEALPLDGQSSDVTDDILEEHRALRDQSLFVNPYLRLLRPLPARFLNKKWLVSLPHRNTTVELTLSGPEETSTLERLGRCIRDEPAWMGGRAEEEEAYNILLQRALVQQYPHVAYRRNFDEDDPLVFGSMKVLPGFKVEAGMVELQGERSLLINVNPQWRVLSGETVWGLILRQQSEGMCRSRIERFHIGRRVLPTYGKATRGNSSTKLSKSHAITGILWNMTIDTRCEIPLPLVEGEEAGRGTVFTTHRIFWRVHHNIELQETDQCLLSVIASKGEAEEVVPSELYASSHVEREDQLCLPYLCSVGPAERVQRAYELIESLVGHPILEAFGVRVEAAPILVSARQLKPVTIELVSSRPLLLDGGATDGEASGWEVECQNHLDWAPPMSPKEGTEGLPRRPVVAIREVTPFIIYEEWGGERLAIGRFLYSTVDKLLQTKRAPVRFIDQPVLIEVRNSQNHVEQLRRVINAERNRRELEAPRCLVYCILSNGRSVHGKRAYNQLKQWCNSNGVVSQCVNLKAYSGEAGQPPQLERTAHKLMQQIVNKFGEVCWRVRLPSLSPSLKGRSLLFLGIDIYHCRKTLSPEEMAAAKRGGGRGGQLFKQRRSMAAVIAITLTSGGKWLHYARHLPTKARCEILKARESTPSTWGQEAGRGGKRDHGWHGGGRGGAHSSASAEYRRTRSMDTELEGDREGGRLAEFLEEYKSTYGWLKIDEIILYRDGVATNQVKQILDHEVSQIQSVFPETPLTCAVLQKRILSRFVLRTPKGTLTPGASTPPLPLRPPSHCKPLVEGADEAYNLPKGTVVEDLGDCSFPSFYLVPNACDWSTTVPVKYIIAHRDDRALSPNDFQQMTFGMCHMYPNWADSIKLPFPTQCAHKYALQLGSMDDTASVGGELRHGFFYL